MNATQTHCPVCGNPMPATALGGLCPKCLLTATLEGDAPAGPRSSNNNLPPASPTLGGKVRSFGDYELLEEIAHGGMGAVFKARQASINRIVALKIILAGKLASPHDMARFRNEARAAANLDHPNIVPIYEVGEHEGQSYFTMRFVEGGTLAQRMAEFQLPAGDTRGAAASESRGVEEWSRAQVKNRKTKIAHLLVQVARAVHHAHQRGILHRDLKPGNILLDARGEPFVSDFGLARTIEGESDLTGSAGLVGTPAYMSPEQAETKSLTTSSDVFSLGAILYELLTGRPPFQAPTAMATIRRVLEKEPKRPRLLQPAVDADLETICLKCLEKDPVRRYASTDALANDLEYWIHDEPIRARPVSTWEHTRKWLRRRPPIFFAMSSAVVISLTGGLTGMVWHWNIAVAAGERADANAREAQSNLERVEVSEREMRRHWYAASMNLAQQAWEANDVARVRQLLEETALYSERGYEWYYWQRLTHLELQTLRGQPGETVRALACSADSQWIVTGADDGSVIVWDAVAGRPLHRFTEHRRSIRFLALSPDARHLVTGSEDGIVMVWDLADGRWMHRFVAEGGSGSSMAVSADGQRMVTVGRDDTVTVREVASGRILCAPDLKSNPASAVALSPDGRFLVTGHVDGNATLWDTTSGEDRHTFLGHCGAIAPLHRQIRCVVFSPDGRWIATGNRDGSINVWDAASGQHQRTLTGQSASIRFVAFSPDGQRVVAGTSISTLIWTLDRHRDPIRLGAHSRPAALAAFSPDGKWIVTSGMDATVKVWETASGRELHTLKGHDGDVVTAVFSPDAQWIVTGSVDGTTRVWSAEEQDPVTTLLGCAGDVSSVDFSLDGQWIVTGNEEGATLWEAASGQERLRLRGDNAAVCAVVFCPENRRILTGGEDAIVRMWDLAGNELLSIKSHTEEISTVAFSPDGRWIITSSLDGTVMVSDASNGQKLFHIGCHHGPVLFVAVSPDGRRVLTGGWHGPIRMWDSDSQRKLFALDAPEGTVTSAAFSPNGRSIVTGGRDGTATVWDAITGQRLLSLRVHRRAVASIAFFHDGRRVVTGGLDGTAKVWETVTGRELLTLPLGRDGGEPAHTRLSRRSLENSRLLAPVAVSPDGRRIATGSVDGVNIWESASPEDVARWQAEEQAPPPRESLGSGLKS